MSQLKWDRRYLKLPKEIASWSKDPSTQTGAVIIAADGTPVSFGYNGFARGVNDDPERYANRELKYKIIVHCERNAIIFGDRHAMKGGTLYTWPFMSCSVCASLVIQAGIKRCVAPPTPEDKRDRWEEDMKLAMMQFNEASVVVDFVSID